MKPAVSIPDSPSPAELGYYFPAEFSMHDATWLSWPHNPDTWPGKINSVYTSYMQFIREVSKGERVCINVVDEAMRNSVSAKLEQKGIPADNIELYIHPTNDAWCRDHGPAFVINPAAEAPKAIVNWGYNAWGGKYPPFDLDNRIPELVGKHYDIPVFHPGIIMEGGSVDFNGAGTLITSRSCLLNRNRNPHLDQSSVEQYLYAYYGVEQVLWVDDGIVGDDTDGHIDDTIRFVNADTVVAVIETDKGDDNYEILQHNLRQLREMRLISGRQLDIIELPMPDPVYYNGQRLPASYANFYISNASVIVPTFRCSKDDTALEVLQACFPDRNVIGIDSTDIIWGLGSFHCLSQQEPAVPRS